MGIIRKLWNAITKSKCPICREYIFDESDATGGFFNNPAHYSCIAEKMGISELHDRVRDLERQVKELVGRMEDD
jgi:hypothetical protein